VYQIVRIPIGQRRDVESDVAKHPQQDEPRPAQPRQRRSDGRP
jgi:hypothetical protein